MITRVMTMMKMMTIFYDDQAIPGWQDSLEQHSLKVKTLLFCRNIRFATTYIIFEGCHLNTTAWAKVKIMMGAKDDYGDGDEDDGDDLPKAAGLPLRPCWPTTKRCPPSPGLQRQLAEFLNGILALVNSSTRSIKASIMRLQSTLSLNLSDITSLLKSSVLLMRWWFALHQENVFYLIFPVGGRQNSPLINLR